MPKTNPLTTNDNRLIISVDDFKTSLLAQIEEGDALVDKVQTKSYEESFKADFKEWNDYNFEFLKQSFTSQMNDQMNAYNHTGYSFLGALGEVADNPAQTLLNMLGYKLAYLRSLSKRAHLFKSSVSKADKVIESLEDEKQSLMDEIFIVHGHDDSAKVSVARFIERLGLKAIILHEQHNGGMTIIEKIETHTNVGFAVVLYTPCDLGGKNARSLQPRARQNVLFEHGYLMAKIGRRKVCALVKDIVETPSDISGVVYTPMDEHGAWHYKLAKELKAAGYDIDMNSL
jgi:hypothetical protein